MFDGIMGSKFSAKCKQAVKTTTSRVLVNRKKKQAMLSFLNKDVADLLAQGHEQHAFNRMDGVISEGNHIRCYDLIEGFCECIAAHLPVMQKLKRECPPECVEAVATLIFAAARFSDLPELCSLRALFTDRYGSAMESSVNPEFKEKVSKHNALSKDGKLKLMQEIAREHGVEWDSRKFGQRAAGPAPAPPAQPKQSAPAADRNEQRSVDGTKPPAYAKKVVEEEEPNVLHRRWADPHQKSSIAVPKEQQVQPKQDAPTAYGKEHNKPVDGMNHHAATATARSVEEEKKAFPRQRPDPYHRASDGNVPEDRQPSHPVARDIHVVAGSKTYYHSESKVERAEVVKGVVQSSSVRGSLRKEESHAEGGRRAAEIAYDGKKNIGGGAAAGEVEKVNQAGSGFRASSMAPPPYVKPRHVRGPSWEKAAAAAPQQGLESVHPVKEDESDRALKEVHLYKKQPSRSKLDDQSNTVASEQAAERAALKKEPNGAASPKPSSTPAAFRPPPYLKPNNSSNAGGNPADHHPQVASVMTPPASGVRLHARSVSEVENHPVPDGSLGAAEKMTKPRSMRRNHRRPPPLVEDAGQPLPSEQQNDGRRGFEDAAPINNGDDAGRISGRRKPRYESNEREGGLPSHQDAAAGNAYDNAGRGGALYERRRHGDRRRPHSLDDAGPVVDVAHDAGRIPAGKHQASDRRGLHLDEEMDEDKKIDWLLEHYSRKGMPERNPQIKRVVSLPHEDSPKAVRVPARAVSSLTDEPSPNGKPAVRHQPPDFDELAARIYALRRS